VSRTVLLVDDSVTQSFHLKLALVRAGFKVITASDGRSALKALDTEEVDVVLADVIMPMMDGYELCRQIKDHPKHGTTPVVLMSALGETHDEYWRQHAGADLYVAKTADAAKLVKTLEDLLAKSPRPPDSLRETS
jgi:DNA-binding response OmpR family regulator